VLVAAGIAVTELVASGRIPPLVKVEKATFSDLPPWLQQKQ
jgi:hypothetical protein